MLNIAGLVAVAAVVEELLSIDGIANPCLAAYAAYE